MKWGGIGKMQCKAYKDSLVENQMKTKMEASCIWRCPRIVECLVPHNRA